MIVRQAANVVDLLEYFARTRRPASLTEIAADLDWPRSSTFNILTTLAQRGYLYEPRPRSGYYLTSRWMELARRVTETDLLPDDLCGAVETMAYETGETVGIAAPAGLNAVLLYVAESRQPVRFATEPGQQYPIHSTSMGRALVVQYSARERAALLRKLTYAEHEDHQLATLAGVNDRILQEAERGWCETRRGDLVGLAISAGIPGRPLSIVAGGPGYRMETRANEIVATLRHILTEKVETSWL